MCVSELASVPCHKVVSVHQGDGGGRVCSNYQEGRLPLLRDAEGTWVRMQAASPSLQLSIERRLPQDNPTQLCASSSSCRCSCHLPKQGMLHAQRQRPPPSQRGGKRRNDSRHKSLPCSVFIAGSLRCFQSEKSPPFEYKSGEKEPRVCCLSARDWALQEEIWLFGTSWTVPLFYLHPSLFLTQWPDTDLSSSSPRR